MILTRNKPAETTPAFLKRLRDETDLGIATLIAEDGAGSYHPIGLVGTIAEGRELASRDLCDRMQLLENGGEPFCPMVYKVWARGLSGFAVATEFEPESL